MAALSYERCLQSLHIIKLSACVAKVSSSSLRWTFNLSLQIKTFNFMSHKVIGHPQLTKSGRPHRTSLMMLNYLMS